MSDEKRSTDDDLDAVAKNIDDLDSVARKASENKLAAEPDVETKPVVTPAASESEEDDEEEDEDEDAANPAAIARRVAALGADDATEALAREEERKLAERRRDEEEGDHEEGRPRGCGFEEALQDRHARPAGEAHRRRRVRRRSADRAHDEALRLGRRRTRRSCRWSAVSRPSRCSASPVSSTTRHKHEAEASVDLTKAVLVQQAKIGEPKKDDDEEDAPKETYFKTYDDRRHRRPEGLSGRRVEVPRAPAPPFSRASPKARSSSTRRTRTRRSPPSTT